MIISIPILIIFILVGCAPITQDMPDKQNYNDIKMTYDSIGTSSPDSLYERCDREFGDFLNRYPESSYRDNALYYRGLLNRDWCDSRVKEVSSEDLLEMSIRYSQMIQSNEGMYNEALYLIAESYDELYKLGQVDLEIAVSAYENVQTSFPNSSKSKKITERLEELANEE